MTHKLQQQYTQALEAFKELAPGQPVPSLEAIKITPKQQAYMDKHPGRLVITPALGFYPLIEAFDKKQSDKTYVYRGLWNQYDLGSELRVDYVLDEQMFFGQTYDEQRKSLAKLKKNYKVGLYSIDPRTYVTLNAIRRENGEKLLDRATSTRFVQLPVKPVVGVSWVGFARSNDDQLWADWSYGSADSYGGLGFSVGLDFDTSGLVLPESFSSELPDELTINGKTYRSV